MQKIKNLIKRQIKNVASFFGVSIESISYGIPKDKVSNFFIDLNKNNVNYLVLRWFEDLPRVEEGEDIDILVSDKDFVKMKSLLKRGRVSNRNFIKIDLFPVTSQKRFMSYYPPLLAKEMLKNRVKHISNAYVPMEKYYFLSLVYHVLFHKGFKSGIKSKFLSNTIINPEHDYDTYIKNLMKKIGIKYSELSLEGLEVILDNENWLPPLDLYFRRSKANKWVYHAAQQKIKDEWKQSSGLVVFVVRERGVYTELINKLRELIVASNAEIVQEYELNSQQARYFKERARGGDWGRGPSIVSGGLPKYIVTCQLKEYETNPKKMEDIPQGVVEYDWVKSIKVDMRKYHLKKCKRQERCNILHSSDNGVEASYYLSILE